MTTSKLPDKKILDECFSYNPSDGSLVWKSRPRSHFVNDRAHRTFNGKLAGFEAGAKVEWRKGKPGAVLVKFRLCNAVIQAPAHRIIFAMLGIEIPPGIQIDHADLNPYNNRLSNLRLATNAQNNANKPGKQNRMGVHAGLPKGVNKVGRKFFTQIKANGARRYIGIFDTPEEAHEHYLSAAKEAFGEFARG